mgnify:CR=1 FL=1
MGYTRFIPDDIVLKAFTEPLKKEPRFFVCGRGVIVNLEHAADFRDAAFCMTDGSRVYSF